MIKNKKLLIVFIIVLFILIAGTIAAVLFIKPDDNTNSKSISKNANINIVNSQKENIKSIAIENKKGSYTLLQNEADKYSMLGSENVALSIYETKSLFDVFSVVDATSDIGINEKLSEFGLEPAIATAVITYDDNTTLTFKVGKTLASGSYYSKTDRSDNIYIVDSSIAVSLLAEKHSFFSKDLMSTAVTEDTLKSFSILDGTTVRVTAIKNSTVAESSEIFSLVTKFLITEPFSWSADDNIILGSEKENNGVINNLKQLIMSEVVSDNIDKATLDKYGLTRPAHTLTIYDIGKTIIYFSEKQPDNTYYTYSSSTTIVGKIRADVIPFMEKKIDYFCSKLMSLTDIKLVNSVVISSIDKSYKFDLIDSDKSGDEMKVMYNGTQLSTEEFRHLYTVSLSATISGVGDKPNNTPYVTVELALKDGTKTTIKYYNYGNSLECFAELNGDGKFVAFKSSVDKIIKSTLDYIDGKKVNTD